MAVKYQDYYDTLGVPRTATRELIQNSYRKLARKYHPDVNKSKDAEEKFKQINEAYEVLRDPEKRRRYDQLGTEWHAGDDFSPPPGWDAERFGRHAQGNGPFGGFDIFEDIGSGFSDFFESIFGGLGGFENTGPSGRAESRRGAPATNLDHHAEVTISLRDAYHGGKKTLSVQQSGGKAAASTTSIEFTVPPGTRDGKKLRLRGQGVAGPNGRRGDLYLTIRISPDPAFRVEETDLETDLPVTPWEAALGARVDVQLLDGRASLTIPPGTQCGKKLRLKGKGLTAENGSRGDLYATVRIVVPPRPNEREQELYRALAKESSFNPRRQGEHHGN